MRQGGTFETRAAHNKSHHRCDRRPGSSGLPSAREAAPRGAQRDRSEGPENRGPGPRRPRRWRRRQRRRWEVRRQPSPRSTGLTGATDDRDRETGSVQPAAHRALTTTTRSRSLFQASDACDAHYHQRKLTVRRSPHNARWLEIVAIDQSKRDRSKWHDEWDCQSFESFVAIGLAMLPYAGRSGNLAMIELFSPLWYNRRER